MSYCHLSREERYRICFFVRLGLNVGQIAAELHRSPSTISRELKRGRGAKGYRHDQAHARAIERGKRSRNQRRIAASVWLEIEKRLNTEYSPEQISNTLGTVTTASALTPARACTMSIYRYIECDKAAGGALYKKLRCQRKVRRRYAAGYGGQGKIRNRRDIDERPAHVDRRLRVGHWEGDTIVSPSGGGKSVLVTMVERKSGFTRLGLSKDRTASQVSKVMIEKLGAIKARVYTITEDNGHEFAMHEHIDAALGCKTYFAHPYASHQRGSVENLNGLIRQYFPKGTNFDLVTDAQIEFVEQRLNSRPRKRLNWKTPQHVFYKSFNRVALRV